MLDNLWFTYKARIQAHLRLARLDFHSQHLLVWYAILSAVLAVITVRYQQALGKDTDLLGAVLSVVLLGVSFAVANRDFRGRSIAMLRNYQELHLLYCQALPNQALTPEQLLRYHELVGAVENHSEMDDKVFRVIHRGTLTRTPNWTEKLEVYCYLGIRVLVAGLLYVAPLAIWYWQ